MTTPTPAEQSDRTGAARRPEDASRRPVRIAGIEGLRGFAALAILVYHVFYYGAPGGGRVDLGPLSKGFDSLRAGVTLFFVLSGFLLYRVFVSAAVNGRAMPATRKYFRNRLLRILPAYWVILVAVAVLFEHRLLTAPLQLLANMAFLQNYIPAYTYARPRAAGIFPAWSLVVEVSFYVVLPALGFLAIMLARRRRVSATVAALVPVAIMVGTGLTGKILARTWTGGEDGLWILEHSLLTHADWFAAGMAVAVVSVLAEVGRLPLPRGWRLSAVAVAGLFTLVATKLYYEGELNNVEEQSLIAIACALLLAIIVLSPPTSLAQRALGMRPVVLIGLASYSVFLIHDPLLRALRGWGLTLPGAGGFIVNLALIAGASIAIAAIVYRYVERPALARKHGWRPAEVAGLGSSAPPAPASPAGQARPTGVLAEAPRP